MDGGQCNNYGFCIEFIGDFRILYELVHPNPTLPGVFISIHVFSAGRDDLFESI